MSRLLRGAGAPALNHASLAAAGFPFRAALTALRYTTAR
jgi:hypothetical protein